MKKHKRNRSEAAEANLVRSISNKDVGRALRLLDDLSKGKRPKGKRARKDVEALRLLVELSLAGNPSVAADETIVSDVQPTEARVSSKKEQEAPGEKKGKPKKKRKPGKSDKKRKGGKKRRKEKTDKKHNGKRSAKNGSPVQSELIPKRLARMLGKKATKRMEKLFRAALERELELVFENEARRWARATIAAAGIDVGDSDSPQKTPPPPSFLSQNPTSTPSRARALEARPIRLARLNRMENRCRR